MGSMRPTWPPQPHDGERYILDGSKIWISLADTADHFLVFANVTGAQGHKGITAFIVERSFPGSAQVAGQDFGVRHQKHGHPHLQRLRGPEVADRVGEEDKGFRPSP